MEDPVYIAYYFKVTPLIPGVEILIAELGLSGFESFVETEDGLTAYIQKKDWKDTILNEIRILINPEFTISHTLEEIEQTNWNIEWEKNFNPIEVDGLCTVRAPFHNTVETIYDIVIEPKMSFGTGHHETTYMMIQHILKNCLKGKKVLDMGCGTAVLAILAEKRGASHIDAIDIDSWCYLNSQENTARNDCKNISVYQGDAHLLKDRTYDVILANINRNILLNDIPVFAKCLTKEGFLFLSGFYEQDIEIISELCNKCGLECVDMIKRNQWVALKFKS